ncbi:sorbitol dehydrogenase-2 [Gongronella butleri]|nr:sorbitol dehydrogenase-2 [Gongronella butleri]
MTAKTNRAVVLRKPLDIAFEDRPVPEIGAGEVLVNVKATGICGSDVHYWLHGGIGTFILDGPMIIGHESAGVIAAVGPGVTHLKVGDRVAMEPGVCCRLCDQCKRGNYNLCPDMVFAATPPVDGTLADYYRHAADFSFKLPENVSLGEGALIEPLSVGLHACTRANVTLGQSVFIFGAGPVGLLTAASAKAAGASRVVIADVKKERLDFAKTYYTDAQYILERPEQGEPNIEYSRRISAKILESEAAFDAVFDCTGVETCVQTAVYLTKNGGTVMLVGMGAQVQTLPVSELYSREVDIKGVFRYKNTYPKAIQMLASGAIDVKPLITHTYTFDEAVKAFEHARDGTDNAIKIQILNE